MRRITPIRTRASLGRKTLWLAWLLWAGYAPNAAGAAEMEQNPQALTATPTVVSLTFDDSVSDQAQGAEILEAHGMRGTFYVISGRVGNQNSLSFDQLRAMQANGHEIGGHTLGHVDLLTVDTNTSLRQLCQSRYDLMNQGLAIMSFAYPFGSPRKESPYLSEVESMVRGCGYNSARGSGDLLSGSSCISCPTAETMPPTDGYHIKTVGSIQSTTTLDTMKEYVAQAERNGGGWVPIVMHHVCDGCSSNSIAPALLNEFLDWLSGEVSSGAVVVKTVAQVIGGPLLPAVPGPPPTAPPAPGANLLANPSLEQDHNEDQIPDCWQRGGSGTSTATYSLTTFAHSGAWAQQIDVTDYASGGRRLVIRQDLGVCAPMAFPGHVYDFSAWYTSTADSRFTAYVLDAAGNWGYFAQSPILPITVAYAQGRWTIPALPAGSQSLSVGLTLVANGQVRMDDFDLHEAAVLAPISIATPSNGATVTGIAPITASNVDASVVRVRFFLDGKQLGTRIVAPWRWNWDTATAGKGSHTIEVRAEDVASHTTTSPSITVLVR